MDFVQLHLLHHFGELSGSRQLVLSIAAATIILVLISRTLRLGKPAAEGPPMLSDFIPRVSNTWIYMTAIDKFMTKAAAGLQNSTIVGFYLGPKLAYFIKGSENIQAIFKNTTAINSDALMMMGYEGLLGVTPEDITKFREDKSGRNLAVPTPGFEYTPEKERYWAGLFDITHKYLGQTRYINVLAGTYQRLLPSWLVTGYEAQLQEQNVEATNGWAETRLVPFMRAGMSKVAMKSLMGDRILEIVPDMVEIFWDFEKYMRVLLFSPRPKWLFRHIWNALDSFLATNQRFIEQASKEFDWDSQERREVDWEPIFGSPFLRELVRWMREADFSLRSQAGFVGALGQIALNANAVPVTTWGLMEIAQDVHLQRALREEVETTYIIDPETGDRIIDTAKLTALPLLQSVYTEILRMHVSMNVTREVVGPGVTMGGYELPVGALLQAPSEIPHYDEEVWGTKEHAASEFWAERHIKYVDYSDEVDPNTGRNKRVAQFEMMGRPCDFFPYGGGVGICPGRVFAKQEIMLTLATWVGRFEFEFVEWLKLDGTKSDRPAKNDPKYLGSAAVPADRDMKIRWRRIW